METKQARVWRHFRMDQTASKLLDEVAGVAGMSPTKLLELLIKQVSGYGPERIRWDQAISEQ